MPGEKSPKSSTIGTPRISTLGLSANEICRIIKESAKSGVSELRLGNLELKFSGNGKNTKMESLDPILVSSRGHVETDSENAPAVEMEMAPEDKEAVKGFYEAQRLLEDPYSYEEAIMDEDLEGVRREENVEGSGHWGSQ